MNPVIRALREHGIEVTALHNHMLTEEPRLFFMHFWANVETAMFRYKGLIGRRLRARNLCAQKVEARIACAVINRMTKLGMPSSRRVA